MAFSTAPSSIAASSGSFSPLPAELLILVYSRLPSFQDVFSLASTCHRLQDIWLKNIATIYKPVARAAIPCEKYARILLADQGGPSPESEITTASDVARMIQNMQVVDQAIHQFESKIVSKVRARGHRTEDYYGAGARRHPPYLTRTERPRFIRSYYRFWALLTIDDPVERQSRLQSMSFKQLLYLCEMSWPPKSMGPGEEAIKTPVYPGVTPAQRYQARRALSKLVVDHTESTYRRIHGKEMEAIWVIAMDEGYDNFLVMWDHWQSSLIDVVCSRRSREPPYKKEFHMELWDDSSEEETER
ncbi:MAG: hypothetical protein HETSPECPRED_009379 [Heterodermia speciosa]|uniref:F-box domain-containing protein n=1 Tax=Heterodermia speciosa TaxID=116794 RepID=A0A8H3G247_9LECA|nr:MAG: hypothetical protein HETSPECPRED_009379 [Heterodermia speciosa]